MIFKQLDSIMEKPMNRRQFFQHIGLVALGVVGVGSLMSLLNDPKQHLANKGRHGFGGGKFGV